MNDASPSLDTKAQALRVVCEPWLTDAAQKHLDPSAPFMFRAMAAKGMVPLPPETLLCVQAILAQDADDMMLQSLREGAEHMNAEVFVSAANGMPSQVLGVWLIALVQGFAKPEIVGLPDARLDALVRHAQTPDDALVEVLSVLSLDLVEMIAANQVRCLRSDALVEALAARPDFKGAMRDRLFDFLVRSGKYLEGIRAFDDALARLSLSETESLAQGIALPSGASEFLVESQQSEQRAEALGESLESKSKVSSSELERMPVLQVLRTLNVPQRIALAVRGNREARTALLRDANRLVAKAAISSPSVGDAEILAAAKSRTIHEEVLRVICRNKEMTRSYPVKKALVENPKTPVGAALSFLSLLRLSDIRSLARSKNVPSAVSAQAQRMMKRRGG